MILLKHHRSKQIDPITTSAVLMFYLWGFTEALKLTKSNLIYYKHRLFKAQIATENDNSFICRGWMKLLTGPDVCQFDPDERLDVAQIIRRHGYPPQSYVVQTEDGYLLRVHRIPGNQRGETGKQPVYLQHGLLGSSADWILNGNSTLAFYLADNGYDVWIGNARGNIYSRGHVSFSLDSSKFWNFSWHEMATKDLPAVLTHIGSITGKPSEIIYIGHSMGTTMSFVLTSMLPQVAKNLKLIISLAPTAFMKNLRSPIRYLAPYANNLEFIARYLGINELSPSNKVLRMLSYECEKRLVKYVCQNLLFMIAGFEKNEFDMKTLPKIVSHDPAGASTKTLIHYAQEIKNNGNFQQFDYGTKGNMKEYGTPTPPPYKLINIKMPVYLFYAKNDIMTSYIDVQRLSKELPNLAGMYKIPSNTFGHVDFIFGKNAFEYVYKPVLEVMRNYTMKTDNSAFSSNKGRGLW